jgi:hypothetical protein
MQVFSAFIVPGGLAIFVALIGIGAIIYDRRQAARARRMREASPR